MTAETRDYVFVCVGPTCSERGGTTLHQQWKELLVDRGEWERRRVVRVNCFGECPTGPNVCLHPDGVFHTGVDVEDTHAALEAILPASAAAADRADRTDPPDRTDRVD